MIEIFQVPHELSPLRRVRFLDFERQPGQVFEKELVRFRVQLLRRHPACHLRQRDITISEK